MNVLEIIHDSTFVHLINGLSRAFNVSYRKLLRKMLKLNRTTINLFDLWKKLGFEGKCLLSRNNSDIKWAKEQYFGKCIDCSVNMLLV